GNGCPSICRLTVCCMRRRRVRRFKGGARVSLVVLPLDASAASSACDLDGQPNKNRSVKSFLRLASLPLGDPGCQNPRETSCMFLSTHMERVPFYLELWLVDLSSSPTAIREILRFGGWQFAKPCKSILGFLRIRLLPKNSHWIEGGARP